MNIGDTVKIKSGTFQQEVCIIEKKARMAISGGFLMTLRRLSGGQLWVRDSNLELAA